MLGGCYMKLSKALKAAVQNQDATYVLQKGNQYFYDQDYEEAVEYYHLAAAMGEASSLGRLGHCYLYGKGVPEESDLALSYFRIGVEEGDIQSLYELGRAYCSGEVFEKDSELGLYYYEKAIQLIEDEYPMKEEIQHPELYYYHALERLNGEGIGRPYGDIYHELLLAKVGFQHLVENGVYDYQKLLDEVQEKLNDSLFDDVRDLVTNAFENEF